MRKLRTSEVFDDEMEKLAIVLLFIKVPGLDPAVTKIPLTENPCVPLIVQALPPAFGALPPI